jgi:hypothetical protein
VPVKAKDKPLVNAKVGTHSALTLVGMDFTGWDVKPDVADASPTPGKWKARKSAKGDPTKEMRIVLHCKQSPARHDRTDPPDGTLTVTLTMGSTTTPTPVPVDYANDAPPP